jgi:uncharacterized SAM-binding protein YcdF (DUF218 family)
MFVLLKILLFFFRPLIWIFILFALALLLRNEKRKKLFLRLGFIVLVIFTNPFITRKLMQWYEPDMVRLAPGENYITGIVLGGFVGFDARNHQGFFTSSSDRFIQTALLYKTGHIRKIIVSGGNGLIIRNEFKESVFAKEQLINLGIPAEDIFIDTTSRNTLENAINTKQLIDSMHLQGNCLLISSALHLPRARLVFLKNGINAKLYPCDFISKEGGGNFFEDYLMPSVSSLRNWDLFIKELLGISFYKLTGKG